MTFQAASAFWYLLPLGGVIVALYLLKMRRRDVRVPAAFLWPRLTADVRANAPFQRLRVSLLLILQLLSVALLITALANPLRRERGLNGRATVVVLDASASMSASDVSPSRFQSAVSRVRSIVETMTPGDRLALIEAGSTTRVIFPLTGDKPRMFSGLGQVNATDAPNNVGEALRLAAALVGQRPDGRIIVLSDGAFPPVSDFSPGKAQLLFEQVGTGGANVAITAMEAADLPGGSTQVYCGIRNYGTSAVKATVAFNLDGRTVDARTVTLAARQTMPQTFAVPASAQMAHITVSADRDLLRADNEATLYLHGAGGLRVLLVSNGDLFLERALALEPGVRLDKSPTLPDYERAGATGESRYDLIVFDGVPAQSVRSRAVMSFGGAVGMPVTDLGPSQRPKPLTWKRDDPVLRYADLRGLLIQRGRRVSANPEGRVLAEGSDGPLIVASSTDAMRRLYVAFAPLDSDWPLRVSFPIFVSNAVSWLSGGRASAGGNGINVRTGQPFSLTVPPSARQITLKAPDGATTRLDSSSGTVTLREADSTGVYSLSGKGFRAAVAANLLSEAESDILPRATLDISGHAVTARERVVAFGDTWRPILLICLALLAVEWWVFARRS